MYIVKRNKPFFTYYTSWSWDIRVFLTVIPTSMDAVNDICCTLMSAGQLFSQMTKMTWVIIACLWFRAAFSGDWHDDMSSVFWPHHHPFGETGLTWGWFYWLSMTSVTWRNFGTGRSGSAETLKCRNPVVIMEECYISLFHWQTDVAFCFVDWIKARGAPKRCQYLQGYILGF